MRLGREGEWGGGEEPRFKGSRRSSLRLRGAVRLVISVSGLSGTRCPLAIFWAVISVAVFPIQGHAFRTHAHVSKERFKIFPPSVANRDASSAVTRISRCVGVRAALDHRGPAPILPRVSLVRIENVLLGWHGLTFFGRGQEPRAVSGFGG